jgi:hypothetical protein
MGCSSGELGLAKWQRLGKEQGRAKLFFVWRDYFSRQCLTALSGVALRAWQLQDNLNCKSIYIDLVPVHDRHSAFSSFPVRDSFFLARAPLAAGA